MKDIFLILLVNLVLAVVLIVFIRFIMARSPMTAARLRKTIARDTVRAKDELPCGGRLIAAAELQRTLEESSSPFAQLTALLLQWHWQGAIRLYDAPKKEMKSFGAAVQPQLSIEIDANPLKAGEAEVLLWKLLCEWAGEERTLQQGELYNLARDAHELMTVRLDHLMAAGRFALREMGASRWEEKPGKLIFAPEKREIYSPKGIRFARELRSWQAYCRGAQELQREQALFAVIVGCDHVQDRAGLARAKALAEAIVTGAQAGERSARR